MWVITLLENIQATAQNDEDLRALADSIHTTMDSVVETVRTHGTTSAPLFHDVCTELRIYLESLLAELNRTQWNVRSLKHFFKTKNVSDAITGFKGRAQKVKEDFMIRVVLVGNIQLLKVLDNPSISWSVNNRTPSGYWDYSAAVVIISIHKVVHVYSHQSEAVIAHLSSYSRNTYGLICGNDPYNVQAPKLRQHECLTALELLEFHVQLFRDLKCRSTSMTPMRHLLLDETNACIFDISYSSSGHTVQLVGSDGDVPEISNLISRILPIKEFQKDDLLGIYDSLYYFTPSSTTFTCPQSSHSTFPPGSIFLHSRDASNYLVGDIMVDVKIWIMEEIIDNEFNAQIALPALLGDSVLQIHFTSSRLKSAVDFEEGSVFLQLDLHYELEITPTKNPFQLSDMFMAEDLPPGPPSLSLTPPWLDSHTRNILWPSFILLSDSSEISFEDVEAIFRVNIRMTLKPTKYQLAEKQLFNIPELHTACRFNPALMGLDVCKYFGLPLLRVYDKPMRVSEHDPSARSIWEGSSIASIPEHLEPGITDSYEKVKAACQTMPCHNHDRNESLNYHTMRITASNKKALIKALVFGTIHLLLQCFARWLGHYSSQSKHFMKFHCLVLAHRLITVILWRIVAKLLRYDVLILLQGYHYLSVMPRLSPCIKKNGNTNGGQPQYGAFRREIEARKGNLKYKRFTANSELESTKQAADKDTAG
ncbi:hypothetical protein EDD85DRAFT_793519 [Armillaria nabsnona]|nr:hypothetical protein EDD85DRAFT_793519 [Armillaria nabsnona]